MMRPGHWRCDKPGGFSGAVFAMVEGGAHVRLLQLWFNSVNQEGLPGAAGPVFPRETDGTTAPELCIPRINGRKECTPMAEADDCVYG